MPKTSEKSELPSPTADQKLLLVDEFCARNRISTFTFYGLIKRGELRAVKVGGSTRVRVEDEANWLAALPALSTVANASA